MATATVPHGYICPITNDLMLEPVIDPEGNSYERSAIIEWLKSNHISPITRTPLTPKKLAPNRALKEAIELFKTNNPLYGLPIALVPTVQASSAAVDDSLSVDVQRNDKYMLVSVKATAPVEPVTQSWSDVCCVVDVSGSMGSEVQLKSSTGINEAFGITQLDLVKHAMKTIIECLTDKDRLSLVTFSYSGTVIFDLLVMDAAGKAFALTKLEALDADGGTNLWDGLVKGLEVMCAASACNRNSTVFLLTDGVASSSPPKGIIPMLRHFIDEKRQGNLSCTINTFGFGYDLDSEILQQIAYEGNGTYAFIPDGSFVGTIFINAMSNFLASVAKDVVLSLETVENCDVIFTDTFIKQYKYEAVSWGYKIYLGNVIYGQSKDVLFPISLLHETVDTSKPYARYSLNYTKVIQNQVASVVSVDCSSIEPNALYYIAHHIRISIVQLIANTMTLRKENAATPPVDAVRGLIAAWKQLYTLLTSSTNANTSPALRKYLQGVYEDVNGQISEALITTEYYTKWGRHYLPSIAKAHLFQICNNFKDPGVQFYGGKLFESLRDKLHDIFVKLPPPIPTKRQYGGRGGGFGGAHVGGGGGTRINMAAFANSHGACFHEDCVMKVRGKDGSMVSKALKEVVQGDVILSEAGKLVKIKYILKTLCTGGVMNFVHFPKSGLKITHYHPMKAVSSECKDGKWMFPIDIIPNMIQLPCTAIYSFVVEDPTIVSLAINDTWCVTLGHMYKDITSIKGVNQDLNNEILCHEYFGDRKQVLADLEAVYALQHGVDGIVTIHSAYIHRNKEKKVCSIQTPSDPTVGAGMMMDMYTNKLPLLFAMKGTEKADPVVSTTSTAATSYTM